jgi:O-methyltransferase
MPLTRTQAALKKLLPAWCFTLIYRLAYHAYRAWQRLAEGAYYRFAYVYYALKRDKSSTRKLKAMRTISPYTMVGRTGLLATYDIAEGVEKKGLGGCFVECGVARGGCSALMAMIARENNSGRQVWLFDSFEGLPEQTGEDEYQEPAIPKPKDRSADLVAPGYCLGTYDEVAELLFAKLGLSRDNVFMVKGWFQDTLPNYRDEIGTIAVLRIDADWYESTKCCLENLYNNVTAGGYIIIDDYASTDEFLKKKNINVELIFDKRGGCYFIKP